MAHDWMLDVLADLRSFASQNGLGATERQLASVLATCADEIGTSGQGMTRIGHVGEFSRSLGSG